MNILRLKEGTYLISQWFKSCSKTKESFLERTIVPTIVKKFMDLLAWVNS